MKKIIYLASILLTSSLFLASCDKIENPFKPADVITIDTSLYPGEWDDYIANEYPVFSPNTNTNVNVLVEDFTGHTCVNCPPAADLAHDIQDANPNRVYVASIHIDPGASLSFQKAYPNNDKYYTDHTNADAVEYGERFADGYNFWGNPQGTVNRATVNGDLFAFTGTWQSRTSSILDENILHVNIQSVFNYYEETNGGYLHAEFEKTTNDALNLNAVVYVIQDTLTDWQKMPDNSDNEFYLHQNKHLGSIDDRPWGRNIFTASDKAGEKIILDYSYKIPEGHTIDNLHFLIYVYDTETYEIYQVIKQTIE